VLPLVAIVRADWCPACRNVEPKLALIEQEYAGRIAFLRLDVTDDDTTAGATRRADAAGVAEFFGESKGRTATIGVFSKDRKELFRTWGLKNEADLRQALELAATP
jgi:thiol-disulfide isomerase/thioredoxin